MTINSCSWTLFTTCQVHEVAGHYSCVKTITTCTNLPVHWLYLAQIACLFKLCIEKLPSYNHPRMPFWDCHGSESGSGSGLLCQLYKWNRINYQVQTRGNVLRIQSFMVGRSDIFTGVGINYEKAFNIQQIFEKDPFLLDFPWICRFSIGQTTLNAG